MCELIPLLTENASDQRRPIASNGLTSLADAGGDLTGWAGAGCLQLAGSRLGFWITAGQRHGGMYEVQCRGVPG